MTESPKIPDLVQSIPLEGILRIDVGLEGDWSPTVKTVWSRGRRSIDFSQVTRAHPSHKPSLELYFEGAWLGVHCFQRIDGDNVFDEERASRLIQFVETSLAS